MSVLEDSEERDQDIKRIMFVEEQKISAAGYQVGTQAVRSGAEEAKDTAAAPQPEDQGEVDEEEQKKQAET